jgi:hypothetical protein
MVAVWASPTRALHAVTPRGWPKLAKWMIRPSRGHQTRQPFAPDWWRREVGRPNAQIALLSVGERLGWNLPIATTPRLSLALTVRRALAGAAAVRAISADPANASEQTASRALITEPKVRQSRVSRHWAPGPGSRRFTRSSPAPRQPRVVRRPPAEFSLAVNAEAGAPRTVRLGEEVSDGARRSASRQRRMSWPCSERGGRRRAPPPPWSLKTFGPLSGHEWSRLRPPFLVEAPTSRRNLERPREDSNLRPAA